MAISGTTTRRVRIGLGCLFAIAVTGYLVQCFTPLRLTEDAYIYLSISSSAAHGTGFNYYGIPTQSPLGYPVIVWLLTKAGLGRSWWLNLVNLSGIAVGLLATASIARSRGFSRGRLIIVILACLYSYALIKHAAIPLTDVLFFGATLAAIAFACDAVRQAGRGVWIRWAASLFFAAVSLSLRLAGIAVVIALLFEFGKAAWRSTAPVRIVVAVFFVVAGAGAGEAVLRSFNQTGPATGTPIKGILHVYRVKPVALILSDHFLDLGQVVLNVPESKVPSRLVGAFYAAGFLVIFAVGLILARSLRKWDPARTALVCYSLMIFSLAYTPGGGSEPRYWLPALPLLAMELVSIENPLSSPTGGAARLAVRSYGVWFLATGMAAFAYSAVLTVSRRALVNAPAMRQWKNEYAVWLLHEPATPESRADARVLSILREYGGNRQQ